MHMNNFAIEIELDIQDTDYDHMNVTVVCALMAVEHTTDRINALNTPCAKNEGFLVLADEKQIVIIGM